MGAFFLALFIVVGFISLIIFIKVKEDSANNRQSRPTRKNSNGSGKPQPELKREIKNYSINGIHHRNPDHTFEGAFSGTVVATYHPEDPNCIEVRFDNGVLAGYLPRGNHRLHKALKEWHNGTLKVWGFISSGDNGKYWNGSVNLPLGLPQETQDNIFELIKLRDENESIFKQQGEIKTSDAFFAMDNFIKILDLSSNMPKNSDLYFHFPLTFIPSFSKRLEEKKDWASLSRLADYHVLIDSLSDTFKNSTLKRIEKAQKLAG